MRKAVGITGEEVAVPEVTIPETAEPKFVTRVGDIVLYRPEKGGMQPALVQALNPNGSVHLWVFQTMGQVYTDAWEGPEAGMWMARA